MKIIYEVGDLVKAKSGKDANWIGAPKDHIFEVCRVWNFDGSQLIKLKGWRDEKYYSSRFEPVTFNKSLDDYM